ncbi:uncharacterized protein LOC115725049 isoform X1 [Cannabis sativa]|uniref:uncharacterized protein LOC115725049 isoform X1 n=2 Tax=Cannabis sativa TaxID=3483 RepID=UPI0029CA8463|nr:uncharacterized protein LOC115725049 isoform X1 [Cannabis sativa]
MGNRKERRRAAMSNTGRRVKLDLFAEPSGDLGGSNHAHNDDNNDDDGVGVGVGEDIDNKHGAGLPNSPSSSGQQPENPLLLLGQYSDDDDQEDEKLDEAAVESSLVENNNEVKGSNGEGCLDMDANKHESDKTSSSLDVNHNLDDTDRKESDDTASTALGKGDTASTALGKDLETGQIFAPVTSDLQPSGDVSSGWQMVLHEESNRYYYWNTITGETSWEIPGVLAQASELTNNHASAITNERTENAFVGMHDPSLSIGPTFDGVSAGTHIEGSQLVDWSVAKNEAQNDTNCGNDVVNASSVNDTLGEGSSMKDVYDKLVYGMMDTEGHGSGMDLSTSLIERSESLIEKFKTVKGSDSKMQSIDCISRCILEVEIRLSDIKALSSFGSSLHEFWVHSERRIKQLEDYISGELSNISTQTQIDNKIQESSEADIGTHTHLDDKIEESSEADVSTMVNTSTISSNDRDATNAITCVHVATTTGEQVNNGAACPEELNPKQGSLAAEDDDMDVDMEVDDASAGNTAIVDASVVKESAVQPIQQTIQPAGYTSLVPGDVFSVPPPPDEEWIPPPPPDNEQIPPPPPDEPPLPIYPLPPSYPETAPTPYAEQYNLSYPNSNYEYYGQAATEIPGSNFYGQAVAPVYYDAVPVPNTYSETPQVTAVAYYDYDSSVPPAPGVSSVESSLLPREPASIGYGTLVSNHVGSVHSLVEANGNSLPSADDSNSSAVVGEIGMASLEVPSTKASTEAPIVSAKESDSVPPVEAVPATAATSTTTTATKVHAKVPRVKKRSVANAPSLRLNKKVSSLVDKWKAAKEELREDEEPENAYEMLEKKRQREIEEWKAQQIASGEAKDNANFQPLGGDWRERVKRRRAQQAKEAARKTPESSNDENPTKVVAKEEPTRKTPESRNDEIKKPVVSELSRDDDLPSGWQAYWDESSKQIYYGNLVTSETTWIKPTK